MLNFYNNLSPTTRLLIQSFLSVLGSVLAGVGAATYQSYTNAGHLDMQALINVSLATFALLFGKTMYDWVPGHAQQLIQAYKDSEMQLRDALQRQQNISSAMVATQGKQVQFDSTLQVQQPPQVIVQAATLTPEHVQAISQQIARNLLDMTPTAPQRVAANNVVTPFPIPARPQALPAAIVAQWQEVQQQLDVAPLPGGNIQGNLTRHFGDSQIIPVVQQPQP